MMEGGICAAVEEDVALGLTLSGVTDLMTYRPGMDESELRNWYRKKIEQGVRIMVLSGEVGMVLSRELFERRVSGELLPVTVIIPGEEEDSRAQDLIKRAIGMVPAGNVKQDDEHDRGG